MSAAYIENASMDVERNGVASTVSPDDIERKQAMRKAGQEYFNRVLEQATKGGDPFIRQHNLKKDAHLAGVSEDPDLVAFGVALEGSKLYLLMGVLVVTQASSLVSLKGALLMMPTPGVIAFLHMLAVVLVTPMLSAYGVVEKPALTVAAVKGCVIQGMLHGLQTWAAFSALLHGSVYLVLTALFVVSALLEVAAARRMAGISPGGACLASLILGLGGAVVEFAVDHHHGFHTVAMILVWVAGRALEQGWHHIKHSAVGGGSVADGSIVARLQELATLEQKQNASTQLLLQNLLPALPVLVVALGCLEGNELVEHEPSVPGLEVLLTSCVLYAAAAVCQVHLLPSLGNRLPALLQWGSGVGSIIGDFLERAELSLLAAAAAVVALTGSTAALWRRGSAGDVPPLPITRPIG